MPWTEQQIVTLLDSNPRAVERAIVAIYERQTADEKQTEHTRHDNSVGFRQNHAKRMSYYARLIKSGRHLYPRQLDLSRAWMKMYRRQLADIANTKKIECRGRSGPKWGRFQSLAFDFCRAPEVLSTFLSVQPGKR